MPGTRLHQGFAGHSVLGRRRFSETASPGTTRVSTRGPPSMRPGLAAAEREVVRIGDWTAHRFLRLDYLIGDALALAIGDRLFLAVEVQRDLLLHVAGRGPAHQRLDRARLLGLVVELPFLGLRPAGLHRVLGGLENACGHWRSGPLCVFSFDFDASGWQLVETSGIV